MNAENQGRDFAMRLLQAGALSLLLAVAFAFAPTPSAQAKPKAAITVNTLADNDFSDAFCSLREALIAANTNAAHNGCPTGDPGLDTINFSVVGTITLGANLPAILEDLNLSGPGVDLLTISGNNARRVLTVSSGTVIISRITIANGRVTSVGGAGLFIDSGNHVTLSEAVVFNNVAVGSDLAGGGIYSTSPLTLTNTSVYSNSAEGGGGILSGETLRMTGGAVYSNHATGCCDQFQPGGGILLSGDSASFITGTAIYSNTAASSGGGISVGLGFVDPTSARLTLSGAAVYSNTAVQSGGGIEVAASGILTAANNTLVYKNTSANFGGGIFVDGSGKGFVLNSSIYSNTAQSGGGIYTNFSDPNIGRLTISNTLVAGNVATSQGGGLGNAGILTVTASTIFSNTAISGGGIRNHPGGIANLDTSAIDKNGSSGDGAGIFNSAGITVTRSTLSNNRANLSNSSSGGGLYNVAGKSLLSNVTVSGNRATWNGGGIAVYGGTVAISNTTITNNFRDDDNDLVGDGGAVYYSAGDFQLMNSIVANPNQAVTYARDLFCNSSPTSFGYNLVGFVTNCSFLAAAGDQIGTVITPLNPKLSALSSWGGPTLTHGLLPGSPALNAGNNATCLSTDQRGVARPVAGTCDIGAFEGALLAGYLPLIVR